MFIRLKFTIVKYAFFDDASYFIQGHKRILKGSKNEFLKLKTNVHLAVVKYGFTSAAIMVMAGSCH
jgi:hypothetical protein